MSDAISSILSQIRAHELRSRSVLANAPASGAIATTATPGATPAGGFSQTLTRALDGVSRTQNEAGALAQAFEMGDPRADLARVMVAMQQSQVAFRATVEVRNRLVQAYQDVMNMPV